MQRVVAVQTHALLLQREPELLPERPAQPVRGQVERREEAQTRPRASRRGGRSAQVAPARSAPCGVAPFAPHNSSADPAHSAEKRDPEHEQRGGEISRDGHPDPQQRPGDQSKDAIADDRRRFDLVHSRSEEVRANAALARPHHALGNASDLCRKGLQRLMVLLLRSG